MFNSGVSVRLLEGDRGRFTLDEVVQNVNVDDVHFPASRLVCVENTCNKGGGSIWRFEDLRALSAGVRERALRFHLDGARFFNALTETGESAESYGELFDSVSICLSKGLGAPVGSLIVATRENIKRARRIRKVLGGGMRQAGYLAAAGIYALDHHIARLGEDHQRARELGRLLEGVGRVAALLPIDSNIVVAKLQGDVDEKMFLRELADAGVLAVPFGPQTIRLVTHLEFNDEGLDRVASILNGL